MKPQKNTALLTSGILFAGIGISQAVTIVTVMDATPLEGQPAVSSGTIVSTYDAAVSDSTVPYSITGLDLSAEGGSANETVNFNVSVSSTDANSTFGIRGPGNFAHVTPGNGSPFISQAGGETNFTYTAALTSTTYTGGTLDLDFTLIRIQNFGFNGGTSTTDSADVVTALGITPAAPNTTLAAGAGPVATLNNYGTSSFFGASGYDLSITATAVPEPSSAILMGLGAFALGLRRKRC